MSDKYEAFVWEHSPYTGDLFIVHLALGDIANDTYEARLWVSREQLAKKARTSVSTVKRALRRFVVEGYLEVVQEGGGRGKVTEYRFLRKQGQDEPLYDDTETGSNDTEKGVNSDAKQGQMAQAHLLLTQGNSSQPNDARDSDAIVSLCDHLADRIAQYHGDPAKRPRSNTAAWRRSMDRLMRIGPAGRAAPSPIPAERIHRCIDFVFDELAEVERGGFCWAANIRSPGALREHWDQLLDAGKRKRVAKQRPADPRRRGGESLSDLARRAMRLPGLTAADAVAALEKGAGE